MDAVDREFERLGINNPYRFARASGVDMSLAYKVLKRQAEPTNAFILGLAKVGIDLGAIEATAPDTHAS